MIDFGDTSTGDVAWDLAVLTLNNPDMITSVLDGYGADDHYDRHLRHVLPAYYLLRRIGGINWRHDNNLDFDNDLTILHQQL